jgi:DtxR family Mn-dependent transcriptional regulator
MSASPALSRSLEDYLETIYLLIREGRVARVKDVAARLKVQMPSVTGALRSLAAKKLVEHDPYSYITLTDKGEAVAREMARRHEVLTHFLTEFLGIKPVAAERNACEMEHAIEPVVLDRLVDFIEHAERCPRANVQWMHGMANACKEGQDVANCIACVRDCLESLQKEQKEQGE